MYAYLLQFAILPRKTRGKEGCFFELGPVPLIQIQMLECWKAEKLETSLCLHPMIAHGIAVLVFFSPAPKGNKFNRNN